MKFFANLGLCCGRSSPPVSPQPVEVVAEAENVGVRGNSRPKKVNGGHWRPELSVIAEDCVVSLLDSEKVTKKEKKIQSGKKKSSKCKAVAKGRICGYNDDQYDCYNSRKSPMPIIIPPFTGTPFMF